MGDISSHSNKKTKKDGLTEHVFIFVERSQASFMMPFNITKLFVTIHHGDVFCKVSLVLLSGTFLVTANIRTNITRWCQSFGQSISLILIHFVCIAFSFVYHYHLCYFFPERNVTIVIRQTSNEFSSAMAQFPDREVFFFFNTVMSLCLKVY